MKTKKFNVIDHEKYLIFLQRSKTPHVLKTCNNSTTIKVKAKSHYFTHSDKVVDSSYLNFIKRVKKEVILNAEKLNLKKVNPKYVRFCPVFESDFFSEDFVEIDIDAAYWFTAFDFGLISEETYFAGLEAPKSVRLMALGSCAVRKDVFKYDGERYTYLGAEYDEFGRRAFFNVASRIGQIMEDSLELINGHAAFYWVDAIFVKKQFADFVEDHIKGIGYGCHRVNLAWLKGDAKNRTISALKIISESDTVCEFKIKTYFRQRKKKS